jgi:hypothetical protein
MSIFKRSSLKIPLFTLSLTVASLHAGQTSAQAPTAIAAPGATIAATFHAEGAQVYECKSDSDSELVWQAREPIATLILDGKTAGRHYAGPSWEHIDGSAVLARVVDTAPGSTPNDIPWLKLDVTIRRGVGALSGVTTVLRINTKGGTAQGPCDKLGSYRSVRYSADYVFLRRGPRMTH